MDELMKQLLSLVGKGYSIQLNNQMKRVTLPDGERDFAVRVVWEATQHRKTTKCDWDGFETAEAAIRDLVSKIK